MNTINKIWAIVGTIAIVLFVVMGVLGSVLINRYNRYEIVEVEDVTEAEEVATIEDNTLEKLIKENPEKFFNQKYTDSLLKEVGYYKVTATVYNPVASQCDSNPHETADMSKINLKDLEEGKIKWVALSRDLLEYFNYGDKILVISEDSTINGVYEVHDTMNKRFSNYMDFLRPVNEKTGKWRDVIIRKIED